MAVMADFQGFVSGVIVNYVNLIMVGTASELPPALASALLAGEHEPAFDAVINREPSRQGRGDDGNGNGDGDGDQGRTKNSVMRRIRALSRASRGRGGSSAGGESASGASRAGRSMSTTAGGGGGFVVARMREAFGWAIVGSVREAQAWRTVDETLIVKANSVERCRMYLDGVVGDLARLLRHEADHPTARPVQVNRSVVGRQGQGAIVSAGGVSSGTISRGGSGSNRPRVFKVGGDYASDWVEFTARRRRAYTDGLATTAGDDDDDGDSNNVSEVDAGSGSPQGGSGSGSGSGSAVAAAAAMGRRVHALYVPTFASLRMVADRFLDLILCHINYVARPTLFDAVRNYAAEGGGDGSGAADAEALGPLFHFLETQVGDLVERLEPVPFQRLLRRLFAVLMQNVEDVLTPSPGAGSAKAVALEPAQADLCVRCITGIVDFIHADGDGLPMSRMNARAANVRGVADLYACRCRCGWSEARVGCVGSGSGRCWRVASLDLTFKSPLPPHTHTHIPPPASVGTNCRPRR